MSRVESGLTATRTGHGSGFALLFSVGASLGAVGCKQADLPGDYYGMVLEGAENLCTGNGTGYTQDYEYRLIVDGNDVSVAIDDSVWATGTADGCTVTYDSLAWSDYRDGLE